MQQMDPYADVPIRSLDGLYLHLPTGSRRQNVSLRAMALTLTRSAPFLICVETFLTVYVRFVFHRPFLLRRYFLPRSISTSKVIAGLLVADLGAQGIGARPRSRFQQRPIFKWLTIHRMRTRDAHPTPHDNNPGMLQRQFDHVPPRLQRVGTGTGPCHARISIQWIGHDSNVIRSQGERERGEVTRAVAQLIY